MKFKYGWGIDVQVRVMIFRVDLRNVMRKFVVKIFFSRCDLEIGMFGK